MAVRSWFDVVAVAMVALQRVPMVVTALGMVLVVVQELPPSVVVQELPVRATRD